jgi:hypothetical protein
MVRTHRYSTAVALIACLVGTPCSGTLFASDAVASHPAETGSTIPPEAATNPAASGRVPAVGNPANVASAIAAEAIAESHVAGVTTPSFPFVLSEGALGANGPLGAVATTDIWASPFALASSDAAFAQRGYRGRGGRSGRQTAAAIFAAGALVTITGGAILVYSNRPDCKCYGGQGCGYGTRVIGGAILSAGLVGMLAGAVAWK